MAKRKKMRARRAPRRRANPMMPVILANPRRRRSNGRRRKMKRRSNPSQIGFKFARRNTKWGSVKSHSRRVNPYKKYRRRRRSNPSLSFRSISMGARTFTMGQLVGVGIAGMAGIITARIVSSFYTRYAQQAVLGAEGRANPSSWRGWLDDVLRVVVMEVGVIAGERVLRGMKLKPEYCTAYVYGGTAEVGRVAVGTLVKRLSPSTNRATWGLDGPKPPGMLDDSGQLWVLGNDGQYSLAGVMLEEDFQGVMPREQFV